jgi:4-diphosphocytidyl-2-C-methyl-D-erythritol kinase
VSIRAAGRADAVRVHVCAPAKINLLLRVLRRRPDGYHDIETIFQAIALHDTVDIAFEPAGSEGPVTLDVRGADVGPIADNLAVRATRAFCRATGLAGSVHIVLEKNIPAGAGLGGGSSDAAAVLRGLAAIAAVVGPAPAGAASATGERTLHRIGAQLGSDVPFFLGRSPLALGRGRGEQLTALAPLGEAALVLALPPVHVSTAGAYGALAGARADAGFEPLEPRAALEARVDDWGAVAALARNDFEPVVTPAHPEIAQSLTGMRAEGARVAMLSGSGGASFGLFGSLDEARAVASRLEAMMRWPFVAVRTLDRFADPVLLT